MNPEQDNQQFDNSDSNATPADSYMQEMQNIMGPAPTNQVPLEQIPTPKNPNKLVKIANFVSKISLVAWLVPVIGLLVSTTSLVLSLKTKKADEHGAKLRFIFSILGLVLSMACTGAIIYLATNNESSNSTSPQTVNTYPEDVRTAYLEGCSIVFDEATCNCMLQGLENKYTAEEYQTEDAKVYDGTASDEYMLFLKDNQLACESTNNTETE